MSNRPEQTIELEKAIDAITESYDSPLPINNLESSALPNRRAIIDAYDHIAPLVYLGFFSQRPLNRNNLRFSVSEHVYPAYEKLREQIGRAVTYEKAQGLRSIETSPDFAHDAAMCIFRCLPELRSMLNEDAMRAFASDQAAQSVEEVIFSYPTLQAITAHRVAHILYRRGVPMIPRIIAEYAHSRTGIDINPGAKIGRRFFIDHGTGVVIGETSVIGNDVKIFQGVTLGALSTTRLTTDASLSPKRHPTIGDRVTIYAGATILGGETVIGDDSIIGGNAWIVKSVPPGTKLFGRAREETSEADS